MEWLIGVVVASLVFLWVHAQPGDAGTPGDEAQPRPYQWGGQIAEFSYRHPWDDEI